MKILGALALSGSLAAAEWAYSFGSGRCPSDTNCKHYPEEGHDSYENANVCLSECEYASLTLLDGTGGEFTDTGSCTPAKDKVQVLDTKSFFVHLDAKVGHIDSTSKFTANFAKDASDDCELQLEFLPKAVTNCGDPKVDNYPFATQKVKKSANTMDIVQIFQNIEGKAVLVTANDWAECRSGLSGITYDVNTSIDLTGLEPNGAVSSMAVGGLVAAAAGMLWWS